MIAVPEITLHEDSLGSTKRGFPNLIILLTVKSSFINLDILMWVLVGLSCNEMFLDHPWPISEGLGDRHRPRWRGP